MIKIEFFIGRHGIYAFETKGHSQTAPKGEDIVCAAVSSAVFLAANTVTEVIGLTADAKVQDGYMSFHIIGNPASAQDILEGLHLHCTQLAEQYPQSIEIKTISEV